MAKTGELRVEERVIVETLNVKDLWIRHECHFLLSNESNTMRTFGKIDKNDNLENFPQKLFQLQHWSCFANPLALKVSASLLFTKEEPMQEKCGAIALQLV